MTLTPLSFPELLALHGVLDDEQRPLGEHRAPKDLAGAAPTELRRCPYPGSRHQHALPMNLSALRQTTRHWDEVASGLAALRQWCGGGAAPADLGELWRQTAAASVVPAFLLFRADAGDHPAIDAGTAVLFKASLGLKFLLEQRALEELLATGALDGRRAADTLAEYSESSGWLVGRQEVCAATPKMIQDVLRVAISGGPIGPSRMVASVAEPERLRAFFRSAWALHAVLLSFSTGSTLRRAARGVAAVAEDPPPPNELSLTLGMRRLSNAAAAQPAERRAQVIAGFARMTLPASDDGALRARCEELAAELDGERAEASAAEAVGQLERELARALGRDARATARPPLPQLAAFRIPGAPVP